MFAYYILYCINTYRNYGNQMNIRGYATCESPRAVSSAICIILYRYTAVRIIIIFCSLTTIRYLLIYQCVWKDMEEKQNVQMGLIKIFFYTICVGRCASYSVHVAHLTGSTRIRHRYYYNVVGITLKYFRKAKIIFQWYFLY